VQLAIDFTFAAFHPVALLISERVMICLVAGTVLTAGAGLALRLMNRQNARTKFAFCFTTLMGIALFPLVASWHAPAAWGSQGAPVPVLRLPEAWASYIFLLWAVGATIALGRVAFGLYRVRQVRQSCVPVESVAIDINLQRTLEDFQSDRSVQLCTSDLVRVPTAIGFWRPVVALPNWCPRALSSAELHSVVLHELEHLRRYDDWTNLFQRVVSAIFFFHPAVWWLESRLSLEREIACDDAVLNVVPDPKRYARCLVSLAEKSYLRRGIALAQAAVSHVHQLTARVAQILDDRRPAATSIWKPVLSVVVVTVFAGSASLELAPRLVAFQSGAFENRSADLALASNIAGSDSTASTTLSAHSTGQSLTSASKPFDLKPIPARLVAPEPAAKFASKFKRDHARPLSVIAKDSSPSPANKAEYSLAERPASDSATTASYPDRAALKSSLTARSSQPGNAAAQVPPSDMLVMVVHTEQRSEAGTVFWSVRVVQWMVFHPQTQDRVIDPQVPAKT
jgi:beta-lactamase regulating signal transducer with metallopeptidase domain